MTHSDYQSQYFFHMKHPVTVPFEHDLNQDSPALSCDTTTNLKS